LAAAVCGTIPKQNAKDMQQIRSYICHGIQEVVSAPQDQEAYHMLSRTCATINCRLTIPTKTELQIVKSTLSGTDFVYRNQPYHLNLCGQFQITNAMVALEILQMLARHGYPLSEEQKQQGLRSVKLPCKFEILSVMPTIIADSTHSPDAIETVFHSLTELRSLIGAKLWLCLPDENLATHYLRIAQKQGYEIEKIILQPNTAEEPVSLLPFDSVTVSDSLKNTVRYALTELPSDAILLISGTQDFTSKVRHELLKKLGF
jgi:folylpolyglutamate synthase/dihydropteroate synthase